MESMQRRTFIGGLVAGLAALVGGSLWWRSRHKPGDEITLMFLEPIKFADVREWLGHTIDHELDGVPARHSFVRGFSFKLGSEETFLYVTVTDGDDSTIPVYDAVTKRTLFSIRKREYTKINGYKFKVVS